MPQDFIFGQPATRSALASEFTRNNLDSIGTLNIGASAPSNPRQGMPWLDTSNAPTSYVLKAFLNNVWVALAEYPQPVSNVNAVRFSISPATKTWTLTHNLTRSSVSVVLFDLSDKVIEALDIDVTDVNQAVVTHAAPVAGTALVIG